MSYRYGFNGKEKDDEVKGETNSLDFGARMYDPRVGRWFAMDPIAEKYPCHSPYHFVYDNPITTIDPNGKENIVVVGAQNDNSAGNKLMFVHQGIRKLEQYSLDEKNESRTMILFTHGYTKKQLKRIEKEVIKHGGTLIKVNSSADLTNYINSKFKSDEKFSEVRNQDKVTNIDAYSHGIIGSIEFGYHTKEASISSFDKIDSARLNPKAFEKNAVFTSYACRTGIGNTEANGDVILPLTDIMKDMSLAQSIANDANIIVKAYFKRTDYSETLSSSQDRVSLKLAEILGGKSKWYQDFMKRLQNRENIDGATFDPKGAVHPVKAGNTPYGVSDEIQTFSPIPIYFFNETKKED